MTTDTLNVFFGGVKIIECGGRCKPTTHWQFHSTASYQAIAQQRLFSSAKNHWVTPF